MHVSVRERAEAALRARHNWEQLGKFCAVGAVGYVVNLAVYASLLHAGLHYLLAATCSFLVAVASNYTLNRHWTFRDRRAGVAAQGMRFFVVSLASLDIQGVCPGSSGGTGPGGVFPDASPRLAVGSSTPRLVPRTQLTIPRRPLRPTCSEARERPVSV